MTKGDKLIDDRKQISVNLVRYKSHGIQFEIAIEPDKIIAYKNGEVVDIEDIIQANKIFSDMKKGLLSTEEDLKKVFNTTDVFKIAKVMIDKGEIQFTQKYRQEIHEKKLKKIINIIHRNAVDPKTKLPHPINRIEAAMEEAKIKIDYNKSAESQVKEIMQKLQPIIPISVEEFEFSVHAPTHYAAKVKGILLSEGTLVNERWLHDGSAMFVVRIAAGRSQDLISNLNSQTHASVNIEKIK